MFKKDNKGFTIIEVLIVLAIAGLILLIVFLAVPALQRNSRNTQYKSSAAAVLAAVNEYSTNNNGTTPAYVNIAPNGDISVGANVAGAVVVGKTQGGYSAQVAAAIPTASANATGAFFVATDKKCNGNALATQTTKRSVAILYNVETANGVAVQCTES